jgi:ABC-type antimicrobial peptide transport system permease subunit
MQTPATLLKNFALGTGVLARSRSRVDAEAFFQSIRQKLMANNNETIVSGNESEEEVVARTIANQRFTLALLSAFAGLALLLASVGIYGVLSYLVGQRTQEIGVRMALGAQRADVFYMVLRDGARMTLVGTVGGMIASLGLTRWMASMLFEVKSTDPIRFGAVAVLLCGIALLASYLPAHRAANTEPMVALRYE